MKKMLPWLITILLAITLIAIVAVILFNSVFDDKGAKDTTAKAAKDAASVKTVELSADKRVELTSTIDKIQTNLLDQDYIAVLGFAFQLDTKSTKKDFDKIKDIQIKPIIIRTISDMKPEEINGSKGKDKLCAELLNLINAELPGGGKLTKVEITDSIISKL
ncbi:flagellar basal body protein FliL [Paenibacillus lycopersici]|uniref:Flagellar protein FliL n=1 Tax=Paenibacillus lycopersici TaxID=2704462 RepID=A0A6C0FYX7_9BACL|nr:flagellar basal body-associated FliL family protein [Paenibacillus lycopersici]QHT60703.1 flagellar basal body protein FliL [Paenibacillus lycopersici]